MRKFWAFFSKLGTRQKKGVQLFNTLSGAKELFTGHNKSSAVRMYNCGPTVYGRQHIGNLSMYVFTDTLRRTLEYFGYSVRQVINVTDVGHLSSDQDDGEDKMTLGLKREKLKPTLENMRALGEKYTNVFLEDIRALGIDTERITFPRASDYVPAQIAMIKTLEEKGYTYTTESGVLFDTAQFANYGKLGNINLEGLKQGARVEASDKRNPTDFLLWKKDPKAGWESPWGLGFPGWHIECSAMIRATLGQQIDIHTGGIEHIPVHHNNEIAQSESATGKRPFSRFWLHRAHLQLEGNKIAKSKGNVVYLSDIEERGFHPLSLRYLLLGAHYRTPSNFTWESLGAAQRAYAKLLALRLSTKDIAETSASPRWMKRFRDRIADDLDTPGSLATLWDMTKDTGLQATETIATLLEMDKILGLRLAEPDEAARKLAASELEEEVQVSALPEKVREFASKREDARTKKDWARSDELRILIEAEGYSVKDTGGASTYFKK